VRALDRLHVEVDGACGFVLADRGVAGVGQGAGLSVTETGDIVFIAAESLLFGGSAQVRLATVGSLEKCTLS
jgi:hypothetical protein